jgi:hypothetical protein
MASWSLSFLPQNSSLPKVSKRNTSFDQQAGGVFLGGDIKGLSLREWLRRWLFGGLPLREHGRAKVSEQHDRKKNQQQKAAYAIQRIRLHAHPPE